MRKIILDLCGGTGAWSKPYKEAGYDVRNITLPEYDVRSYEPPNKVYGILAAPPCQMFSVARTRAKIKRDFGKGLEIVLACLDIIYKCSLKNKLAFWALENPRGYLQHFIGRPCYEFSPHEFGEEYGKRTQLWGFFNFPKKNSVELSVKAKYALRYNIRKLPLLPTGYVPVGESIISAKRAITSEKFAWAFYKANS